jgi:16S rRNA (uracil1498-N3)-methyltransferase
MSGFICDNLRSSASNSCFQDQQPMPKPPRFFIAPADVREREITISGGDVRHIRTVLRKQPGDVLTLLDGRGAEYQARIIRLEQARILAVIESQVHKERQGPLIVLGQGVAKSDKMDWVVQKTTELGVSSIVPLMTERTIVKVKDEAKRTSRWQTIAREAAMQSNRVDIPAIEQIVSFNDFIRTPNSEPGTLSLLPWEEGTTPVKEVLRAHADARKIVVLIGPEGGFSANEARLAEAQGFRAVTLGPNILRTETAAIAVLSMILYETGATA